MTITLKMLRSSADHCECWNMMREKLKSYDGARHGRCRRQLWPLICERESCMVGICLFIPLGQGGLISRGPIVKDSIENHLIIVFSENTYWCLRFHFRWWHNSEEFSFLTIERGGISCWHIKKLAQCPKTDPVNVEAHVDPLDQGPQAGRGWSSAVSATTAAHHGRGKCRQCRVLEHFVNVDLLAG